MLTFYIFDMEQILRSEALHSAARRLSFGYGSGMNRALNLYQAKLRNEEAINAKGIFAYRDEVPVGWCLFTRESDGMDFVPQEGHACVQIFVDESCRRQGVGTALLRQAQILGQNLIINCYEWGNPAFFEPFCRQGNFQSL